MAPGAPATCCLPRATPLAMRPDTRGGRVSGETLRSSTARIMSSIIGRVGSSSSGPSGCRFAGKGFDVGILKSASLPRALDVDWNCMATRSGGALQVLLLPRREPTDASGAVICGTYARASRHKPTSTTSTTRTPIVRKRGPDAKSREPKKARKEITRRQEAVRLSEV